ncbi:MAG: ParB/RepB/Spo0J family partition protein [Lactobacillales bacterium]|nr:ParB/RepB/Spo0J family partition protein [Lactobacillales bacterium]
MRMRKEVFILSIDDILPNRFQPRIKFDEKAILELAESIKKHGVIQPIIVRKIADKYEIIAGERRYKASVIAGRTTIPAIITDVDDKESAEIALIENVQRQDMTPIEEAISYKKILDMGYLNQTELATKLGKTQSTIANKLRLLNLDDEVQEALLEERISERHARSLLKLEKKDQKTILDRIIKERLTVRKTDQIINEFLNGSTEQKVIEIVPTKEEIKEEKGDNMNNNFNDMNNNFNIPTGNIIDTNPVQPQQNINPGFMDVDNIANSAKDINLIQNEAIGQKEPFNPFGTPVQNEMPQMDQTSVQPEPFNPFSAPMQIETPQMDQASVQPEPMNPFGTPVQNEMPQMDQASVQPEPFNPFSAPLQNEMPQMDQTPVQPEPMNPFAQPVQNEMPQMDQVSVQPEPMNLFAQPVQNEMPQMEQTLVQPEPMNPFAQSVQNEMPQMDQVPVQPEPFNPFSAPVQNEMPQPIPATNQFAMTDDDHFAPMPNYPIPEEKELTPLMPNFDQPVVEKPALNIIINKIRQCISEIEATGYKVELDELDFENNYELTIKIDK